MQTSDAHATYRGPLVGAERLVVSCPSATQQFATDVSSRRLVRCLPAFGKWRSLGNRGAKHPKSTTSVLPPASHHSHHSHQTEKRLFPPKSRLLGNSITGSSVVYVQARPYPTIACCRFVDNAYLRLSRNSRHLQQGLRTPLNYPNQVVSPKTQHRDRSDIIIPAFCRATQPVRSLTDPRDLH
jgi:hypothetical protein